MPEQPPTLDDPPASVGDPRALLLRYLDWCRETLFRKVEGLSDERLRAPVEPLGWSPLGLIQHLGWVERRWMRWGFAAEDVVAYPDEDEWHVVAPASEVVNRYWAEVAHSRELAAAHDLDTPSRAGGRFPDPATAPSLGRILFHLFQEYARHLGQLDVARELIDGVIGE